MAGNVLKVMVSSNFRDLIEHRAAVRDAIIGQGMLPLIMETDTANPSRGIITSSLAMVDDADAYVVLISNYRYGQVIDDPALNPDGLSVTELEFRRAEARGLPLCIFVMGEDVPVSPREALKEAAGVEKLNAFRTRAQHPGRIIATFTDVAELKGKVIQTLARLKRELESPPVAASPVIVAPMLEPATLPKPPAFYAKPPYTPGHAFEGRAQELSVLDAWARSADPVMVVEAIGGMGKSMLTWQWVNHRAPALGVDWAGRFWYSFYERGADMRDFKITALAYMTGQAPESIAARTEDAVTNELTTRLREKPWLLVLDGLERVLAAYHRSDAAQAQDDEIEGDTGLKDRKPTDGIRPADDDLLRLLPTCGPSKLLISSRLMPDALRRFGIDVPGVAHVALRGLAPEDAEAMLRRAGVKGDGARVRRYLTDGFACHPLVVGFVGGLIRHTPWARMDFERWEDDSRGGAAVNIADPSLTNRRNNILKLAFDALDPNARELLARMGMLANAVGLDVLEALNPALPDPPKEVREPAPLEIDTRVLSAADLEVFGTAGKLDLWKWNSRRDYEHACLAYTAYQAAANEWRQLPELRDAPRWLSDTLADLESRGLLQWDRHNGAFDLHPVVRGYAVGHLDPEARASTGQRVADHFTARTAPNYDEVTCLTEMADRIQVVRALNLAGKVSEAWNVVAGGIHRALFRLECHHETLALMRPLFPNGLADSPVGVQDHGLVSSIVAGALRAIGRRAEEEAQKLFSICDGATHGLSDSLAIRVRNHSITLLAKNELFRRRRSLSLSRAIAATAGNDSRRLWCDLSLISDHVDQARLTEARLLWTNVISHSAWQRREGQLEAHGLPIEAWLHHREGTLTEARLNAAINRTRTLGRRARERDMLRLLGIWHQAGGRHNLAVAAFEDAIQMARDVGLSDPGAEAERGLSLARLGRTAEAEAAALSAERGTSGGALAELWLALGQPDKARDHALSGYKWAWADGPPYYHHWDLERCRAVLRELGEPEPVLPPYDPAKIEPLPYEADINRLLEEHAKKKHT
jgi:tetratricopeptide (TPR) repeat protein